MKYIRILSLFISIYITYLLIASPAKDVKPLGKALAQTITNDWPQVQKDARHSGYSSQTVVGPFTELWRKYRLFPVSGRVQPIVANNLIFIPSNDGRLYALKTSDGSTVWSYTTNGPLVNSAAYDNGKVFFGSTDHFIYAVNATNGTLAWKFQTESTVKTAPVVASNVVFMGGSDGFIYAINALDGSLRWKYDIKSPIYDTGAVDNDTLYFGGMDAKGYAFDITTGNKKWEIQTKGQGFRDRWTVAGNGKVFFTPMLFGKHHDALAAGTDLFKNPAVYQQPWETQRQAIVSHIQNNPYYQPMYVIDEGTGQEAFTPPITYVSGGGQSEDAQPVLLPNGNANVVYRRSFGEIGTWGATTNSNIYIGELVLSTGDILPVDTCTQGGGGWENCGTFRNTSISDESTALSRSGDIIYADIARSLMGLDTVAKKNLSKPVACFNESCTWSTTCGNGTICFSDYWSGGTGGGWRVNYDDLYSEIQGDGNDTKRPTPLVNDTFYILQASTIVAVKGVIRQ